MVVSDNDELTGRVEMLRRHGGRVKYHHEELGLNSRLDEIQAAILRVKLRYLEEWTEARRRHAYRYNELLADVPGVTTPREIADVRAVYHQYTILVDDRDGVQKRLAEAGVQTMIYYPIPLHLQEVHQHLGLAEGSFPASEQVSKRCLSLPMFPEMTEDQQDTVVAAVREAVA
jgi:dTDP-4-amino-4,6-dideoxygalactose transaminase